jgi:hypothetical protein
MLRPVVLQIKRGRRVHDEAALPQPPVRVDALDVKATVAHWMAAGMEPDDCMEALGFRVGRATWDTVIEAATMRAEQLYISGDRRVA